MSALPIIQWHPDPTTPGAFLGWPGDRGYTPTAPFVVTHPGDPSIWAGYEVHPNGDLTLLTTDHWTANDAKRAVQAIFNEANR